MTSQESSTPSILSSSSSSKKARSVPQVGQFGQPMPGNHQFGPQSPAQAAIQPHVWHHDEVQSFPEVESDVEAADPNDFEEDENFDQEEPDYSRSNNEPHISIPMANGNDSTTLNATDSEHYLNLIKPLNNITREAGESVRLKCEFTGNPLPKVQWYKHEAPIETEKGRVLIKYSGVRDQPDRVRARLIINRLDTHDIGFYKCEASNGYKTVHSTGVLIVKTENMNQASTSYPVVDYMDPMFAHFPKSVAGAIGPAGAVFGGNTLNGIPGFGEKSTDDMDYGNGFCQPYRGTACSQFLQNRSIYVRNEQYQQTMESKILGAFSVIMASPDISVQCNRYAISSLCFYVFPLCDEDVYHHPAPRKVCRDECELLESNICRMEYAIAKKHHLIGQADILPDCDDLPSIGSPEGERCIRLGIPNTVQVSHDHSCYNEKGENYRGIAARTISGSECLHWSQQIFLASTDYPELIGHNYCRNPGNKESQPWCFVSDFRKELCDIPKCLHQYFWFYIVAPVVSALFLFVFIVCFCCIRRRRIVARRTRALLEDHHKGTIIAGSNSLNGKLNGLLNGNSAATIGLFGSTQTPGTNGFTTSLTSNSSCSNNSNNHTSNNYRNQRYHLDHCGNSVEMNALLPQSNVPNVQPPGTPHYGHQAATHTGTHGPNVEGHPLNQFSSSSSSNASSNGRAHSGRSPTEFSMSSIRFIQELGEGAFGKVYRGELLMNNGGPMVVPIAIKTLKENSSPKTKTDFRREADLMAELQHPNIVGLIGVCFQEEPMCMLFEYMRKGDLHEYLVTHSPNPTSMVPETTIDPGEVLEISDCLHIATQIAAGMDYLSSHQRYVHRDLATRNILVGEHLTVKISDFGLSRDIYSSDYYRVQSKSLLPVRWMPAESCLYGKFTTESDVWSFGVVLWEIFSFGQQPYSGYSNTEVIEMVRSRQLLPCPANCPNHIYAMMLECWQEMPNQRPAFHDLHSRLRSWQAVHARDSRKQTQSNGGTLTNQNNGTRNRINHYNHNDGAVAYQTTMLADRSSPCLTGPCLPLPPPPPSIPPPHPNHIFGPTSKPTSSYHFGGDHSSHPHSTLHSLQYHASSITSNSSNSAVAQNSRPNTPSASRAKLPILGHC